MWILGSAPVEVVWGLGYQLENLRGGDGFEFELMDD